MLVSEKGSSCGKSLFDSQSVAVKVTDDDQQLAASGEVWLDCAHGWRLGSNLGSKNSIRSRWEEKKNQKSQSDSIFAPKTLTVYDATIGATMISGLFLFSYQWCSFTKQLTPKQLASLY